MTSVSVATTTTASLGDLLTAVSEPTRLRILSCPGSGPLFVSDLVAILELPQPSISRRT